MTIQDHHGNLHAADGRFAEKDRPETSGGTAVLDAGTIETVEMPDVERPEATIFYNVLWDRGDIPRTFLAAAMTHADQRLHASLFVSRAVAGLRDEYEGNADDDVPAQWRPGYRETLKQTCEEAGFPDMFPIYLHLAERRQFAGEDADMMVPGDVENDYTTRVAPHIDALGDRLADDYRYEKAEAEHDAIASVTRTLTESAPEGSLGPADEIALDVRMAVAWDEFDDSPNLRHYANRLDEIAATVFDDVAAAGGYNSEIGPGDLHTDADSRDLAWDRNIAQARTDLKKITDRLRDAASDIGE